MRPPVAPPSERGGIDQSMLIECEADRIALALVNHDERLRRMTEEANRTNVTFYPVHPRGLVVFDSSIEENIGLQQDAANLRVRLDSMRALAVDTDGEALINTNNIEGGLKRIADDLSSVLPVRLLLDQFEAGWPFPLHHGAREAPGRARARAARVPRAHR